MKKSLQLTSLLLFFLLKSNFSFAAAGMVEDYNVDITKNATLFPNLFANIANQPLLSIGFLDVTKPPYNASGNGIIDDTNAIQAAINDAVAANYVVYFPGDKIYAVTKQLRCVHSDYDGDRKFGTQLVGSTKGVKPVIKLYNGSTVTANTLLYFDFFNLVKDAVTGAVTSTADPSRHYCSQFRGIDINMGNNPNVNAISMDGAQYCSIEDVSIYGTSFNAGISDLPGSGGYVANVTVTGGKYGIFQSQFRPNPTINGLTLSNQTVAGVYITGSRGPVVISSFKITSPATPSASYNAVYTSQGVSSAASTQAALCLTDGSIEILGSSTRPAIFNGDQSVTLNNVYVKASVIMAGASAKDLAGSATAWKLVSKYIFTSTTDKGSVNTDFVKINPQTGMYELYDPLQDISQPDPLIWTKHTWDTMPSFEDTKPDGTSNVVDITDVKFAGGATPENINKIDDDRDNIQAAIDAVTTVGNADYGKTVFIPRGHFHIGSPLVFPSGLKIIGAGKTISAIQMLKDKAYGATPLIQSADDGGGSLIMSDFAILPYPNVTLLNIRTNNTIFRDIVTEAIPSTKYVYPPKKWLNSPSVANFLFSGNAGGKIFGLTTDQLSTASFVPKTTRTVGYHFVDVTSKINPLNFYQISIEHLDNSPQVLVSGAKYVSFYGLKFESDNELMNIVNSDNTQVIGGSGNYILTRTDDAALIVVKNSKNILLQNLHRTLYTSTLPDISKYWIVSDKDNTSSSFGVLSYYLSNAITTGLNDFSYSRPGSDLKIYSNPQTQELCIEGLQSNEIIQIYNTNGIRMMEFKNSNFTKIQKNISVLSSGMYILKVNAESFKFLKNF